MGGRDGERARERAAHAVVPSRHRRARRGRASSPPAIVVPKVESAGDLAFVERLLDGAEAAAGRARPLRVQALIETAAGLSRVQEIAGASSRLDALILGYADLAVSLGRTGAGADDLDGWRPAQEMVLLAARAHGLQAIDGPYLGVAVDAAFTAAVGPGPGARLRWQVGDPPLAALGADRRLYADRRGGAGSPRRDRGARAGRARGRGRRRRPRWADARRSREGGRAAHARARRARPRDGHVYAGEGRRAASSRSSSAARWSATRPR